jgi:hypothetical protein
MANFKVRLVGISWVVAGVVVTITAVPGLGCICGGPPAGTVTIRDLQVWYVGKVQLIFEGQVERQELKLGSMGPPSGALSMTTQGAHRVVTLRPSRIYSGPRRETFAVLTGIGLGDCGFDFETDKRYLVFAEPTQGGAFFTSICTGTVLLDDAGPALRLLRGEPAAKEDLIDLKTYFQTVLRERTGSVCGRVTQPDGHALSGANVDLWQVRDDPFPPNRGGESSASDGTFCVKSLPPGKYLLTADEYDWHAGTRLMGFYPGVAKHSEAAPIEVKAGATREGLEFGLRKEPIYTVRVQIVTSDGSPLPWENLGISIDSPDQDTLAYHENHGVDEDGSYTLGGIPPGHYVMSSYFEPGLHPEQAGAVAANWQPARREVDIAGNAEVTLRLVPAK